MIITEWFSPEAYSCHHEVLSAYNISVCMCDNPVDLSCMDGLYVEFQEIVCQDKNTLKSWWSLNKML